MARIAKKLNKKMRKSIRRTFASVLLITSLVIAAIPVPDNVASSGGTTAPPVVTPAIIDLSYVPPATDVPFSPSLDVSAKTPEKAYFIRKLSDGQWLYDWQFEFVPDATIGAIISKYNGQFKSEVVKLPVNVTSKYVMVKNKSSDAPASVSAPTAYEDYYTTAKKAEKMKITEITKDGSVVGDMTFFDKFFKSDLDSQKSKFKQYYIDHEKWVTDGSTLGKEPVKPTELTKKIEDLSIEQMGIYYCDENLKTYGTGFTLQAVINNADKGNASSNLYAYIPKAIDNTTTVSGGYALDDDGFLTEKMTTIGAIGDGAFKDIENVDNLEIPQEIAYIGNGAFENSFIKSVTLANIKNIGNRAFKNCSQLKEVDISSATVNIGNEAFYGTGLEELKFPPTVAFIGHGAFANCQKLKSIDFSAITKADSKIDQYAFHESIALNEVKFGDSKSITSIGDAAFAINTGATGALKEFKYPSGLGTETSLGVKTLAGRSNLEKVVMPADYGRNAEVTLDVDTFYNCSNLKEVEFPDDGIGSSGKVKLDTTAFRSVANKDFLVRGPSVDQLKAIAQPRITTRSTTTAVSNVVPYVFKENGVNYIELSDSNYLLLIDEKGTLASCTILGAGDVDVVIPAKVGEYKVVSIASGAFDTETKKKIKSITIEDDSIAKIEDGVFEDCPKLVSVQLGNSVNSIGNRAFANSPMLETVIFNAPKSGNYSDFTIGNEAFSTKSSKLTFKGEIHPDYAPYKWAMSENNYMDVTSGKRVCYQSQTADAENIFMTKNLTVIRDNSTGENVLLDYPKYSHLDSDNKAYSDARVTYFLEKYHVTENADYQKKKDDYDAAKQINDLEEMERQDGPWNSDYFTRKPYSIKKNYEVGGNEEWQTLNPYETKLVDACLNIEIPKGITSIDVYEFYNKNDNNINWITYMKPNLDSESLKMYTVNQESKGEIAGLFSGNFKDSVGSFVTTENVEKGNDYVKSIALNDVKQFPKYAFDSCEALENVTLGAALTDLGITPFRGCTSTTAVGGNSKYTCTNGIIYSQNGNAAPKSVTDTLTIEECLASRGNLVGEPAVNSSFDPNLLKVSNIRESAFEDCAGVRTINLTDATKLSAIPKKAFKNCENLVSIDLPESIKIISEEAFAEDKSIRAKILGKEVNIATNAFVHNKGVTIISYVNSAAERYANYHDITFEPIGEKVRVIFYDYDKTILKEEHVASGESATPPVNPKRDNYTFTEWKGDYKNVKADSVVIAQYKANANSGTGSGSGSGTGSGSSSDKDDDKDNSGNSSSSKSKIYSVVVIGGMGSGDYKKGDTVKITASAPAVGEVFDYWKTSSENVSIVDVKKIETSFKMPGNKATVTAVYKKATLEELATADSTKKDPAPATNNTPTGTGSTGNGSTNNGSTNNGTTGGENTGNSTVDSSVDNGSTVIITKPGISNTDKATAKVEGSSDDFIVKISESEESIAAVERALLKEYGTLDGIQYFAMDISLYDSSGITKIEDTTGLKVNVTMPIPDTLVTYAGNNKVGAVLGEDELEKLNAKFLNIDGVPCVSYNPTHFSPYTIYVDTNNLTASMDNSPQTGDGIHPKWFLSIGLACLSIVLFMKKDKNTKAKIA